MSAKTESIINDLMISIENISREKTSYFDAMATVLRLDGTTAWVHFDGGAIETPAKMTVGAKVGDEVMVRVANGYAYLLGNSTAPPTDDSVAFDAQHTANYAVNQAIRATNAADIAARGAEIAAQAAENATQEARIAQEAASTAQSSAEEAKNSAMNANTSANNALTQLSTVENVVGTLSWISEHGSYVATSDLAVVPGKFYFIRSTNNLLTQPYTEGAHVDHGITFTSNIDGSVVANGTATANSEFAFKGEVAGFTLPPGTYNINQPEGASGSTWRFRIDGYLDNTYKKSYVSGAATRITIGESDQFDSLQCVLIVYDGQTVNNMRFEPHIFTDDYKETYTVVTTPESNPSAAGYYELDSIDEVVSNYVSTHVALTDEGLFLTLDDSGYKLKLTNMGAYIIDPNGHEVAEYSTVTNIGGTDVGHVHIDDNSVDIMDGTNVLASFGETTIIGNQNGAHIEASGDRLSFKDKDGNEVAYVAVDAETNESVFYMTKAIVVKDLFFGDWRWNARTNGNLALKWVGSEEE